MARPSVRRVRRPCPRSAPRARRSRLRRPRCLRGSMGRSALMAGRGGWLPRPSAARPAPSPPASPPRRRPLAWSRRLWCAWWGGSCSRARWPPLRRRSGRLGRWPRSPVRPRDGLAHGLCALPARPRLASGRLLGRWPQRLPWRGAELGCSFRGGLPPFPRRARLRALPPSPRRAYPCGVRPRAEIIAGDGGRALVPRACGAVGCARGARPCIPAVSAVCLPASGRARSACRAVCAVRALRRASPPSSGGQVRALKGVQSSSVSAWGTGTRLRRSDRRHRRRLSPKPRKKPPL